ncbi:hypothetical protein J4418_04850 [Candidatus Woesearchaeota archaeon]|nr:hypothetical protein [Candidatus Woesearchaeota archaeon]
MSLLQKIKENHWLLMTLTCILPFLILAILIYVFDIRSSWLVWTALAICIGSHLWMMGSMHNHDSKGGKCH